MKQHCQQINLGVTDQIARKPRFIGVLIGLMFLTVLIGGTVSDANGQSCITVVSVQTVEDGCTHESSDCGGAACDKCIKVTIRNDDPTCNVTSLTVSNSTGQNQCFNVCTDHTGWTKSRSACKTASSSVFDNTGGASFIGYLNTIDIYICSNATGTVWDIMSNCCAQSVQVSIP